jgi:hypothetical protein
MMPLRSFCLCLPESPERTESAKQHFREKCVYDVTFFESIHAEKFGLRTLFPYEVDNPGSGFNMGAKPTGIWLGHYMLWSALNLLPDDHFMVLEIDAKFPNGWHTRLNQALCDVPRDFDMLYPGSCCCGGRPTTHIKGEVYHVQWPMCTQCYIVAKKALPVLLRTQRKCYAPIDISLNFHSHPQMKVFTVLPRIVDQFETNIPP